MSALKGVVPRRWMVKRNKESAPVTYSRCAIGKRDDLGGMFFRSAWEANYARYLNLMVKVGQIASWEYECFTFEFAAIKRGTRSYTPDFKVVYPDGRHEWHEVKGWMDPKSVTRLKRMAKYYPREKVIVIGKAWFKSAVNGGLAGVIPTWEYKGRTPKKVAADHCIDPCPGHCPKCGVWTNSEGECPDGCDP